jgi:hypothetical protein
MDRVPEEFTGYRGVEKWGLIVGRQQLRQSLLEGVALQLGA